MLIKRVNIAIIVQRKQKVVNKINDKKPFSCQSRNDQNLKQNTA
jgi:hypothetical protein